MNDLTERLRAKRARVVGPVPTRQWQDYALMSGEEDRAHYVYRIYDADGGLLYIGCTRELHTRINQHYDGSPFNTLMAYWTGWRYPTMGAARRAEAEAIGAEGPEFNVHHNSAPRRQPRQYPAETPRDRARLSLLLGSLFDGGSLDWAATDKLVPADEEPAS